MSRPKTRDALRGLLGATRQVLRLRWVKVLVVLALLFIGVQLALETMLAFTLNKLLADRDLVCRWESLDLSPLSGRASLRELTIRPVEGDSGASDAEGPAPDASTLVEIEYGIFDLSMGALLRGDLKVFRAEVDGVDMNVRRDAEGRWNLGDHVQLAELLALLEQPEEPAPEEPAPEERGELSLLPPVSVVALRMQHARLSVFDETLDPPRDLTLEMSARLSHLRSPDRPVRFGATLTGKGLVDGAVVEGNARWSADSIDVDLHATLGGLQLDTLEPYLATLGIHPAGERVDGRFSAGVQVAVAGEARDSLGVEAQVRDAEWTVDGRQTFGLAELDLSVPTTDVAAPRLERVAVHGARGEVSLEPTGALRIGGFDFIPAEATKSTGPVWASACDGLFETLAGGSPWIGGFLRPGAEVRPWSVGELSLASSRFTLVDHNVAPAATLSLVVDEAYVRNVVHGEEAPEPVELSATLSAPGVAGSIRVEGSAALLAPERSFDLTVALDEIGLVAFEGYLASSGLARAMESGTLDLTMSGRAVTDAAGRTEVEVSLAEVALADSGELFGLREVAAKEIVIDPAERLLRLGSLDIAGPRLSFTHDPRRGLLAFGLQTLASTPPSDPAEEPPPPGPGGAAPAPAQDPPPLDLPRLELGTLRWSDSDVRFTDAAHDPPVELSITDLGFELSGLVAGGEEGAPPPPPAKLTARASAEGLADSLTLEGTLSSVPGALDFTADLELRGEGLSGALMRPYLRPLGIQPELDGGSVKVDVVARARMDQALRADVELTDLALVDSTGPVVRAERIAVTGFTLSNGDLSVERVEVTAPFARVDRDVEGRPRASGFRLVGAPDEADSQAPPAAPAPAPLALPPLPPLSVGELAVRGARLEWIDATYEPPLVLGLTSDVTLSEVNTAGRPATYDVKLALDDALEELRVTGELELGDGRARCAGNLRGSGLRDGDYKRLLPPGIGVAPGAEGGFEGGFQVLVENHQDGGLRASLRARDLVADRDGDTPAGCEELVVELDRFDPLAGAVTVRSVQVKGARAEVARDAAGRVRAAGLLVDPSAAQAPAAVVAVEEPAPAAEVTKPILLPRIEIMEDVVLELARFELRDEAFGEGARPVEASARFTLDGPVLFGGEQAADSTPLNWTVEGALAGLVERWQVRGALGPFEDEPRYALDFEADGVRTAGLTELVPALGELVDGEVEQGRLTAGLEVLLNVRRRLPNELGILRPFSGDVRIHDMAFRDEVTGRTLVGLDAVNVEIQRAELLRGRLHLRSVELETPRFQAERDGAGVHALGFVLDPARLAEKPAAADTGGAAPQEPAGAAAADAEAPGFELRIDELVVDGLDFGVRDGTLSPPLDVQLGELDVEVAGFTTEMFTKNTPVRFSVFLTPSGPRSERVGQAGGRAVEAGYSAEEPRRLFDEVALSGRLAMFPEPKGWVQVGLTGLELQQLAGLAAAQGITVDGGALDSDVNVRLRGDDGMHVSTSLIFTGLSMEEPDGGIIERTLSLPMSLEAALFVLRNASGEHRFSVGFDVTPDGISTTQIAVAATQAFTVVLAQALAGAPLRLIGGVIPIPKADPPAAETYTLELADGSCELDGEAERLLADLIARVEDRRSLRLLVRHELSVSDREHASRMANPPGESCLALVRGLRQRKAELWRAREERLGAARALYAVGAEEAEEVTADLAALSRRIADVEDSIDRMLEIYDKTSSRQRDKRTRALGRELGETRLAEVRRRFEERLTPRALDRVQFRSPRANAEPVEGSSRIVIEVRRKK